MVSVKEVSNRKQVLVVNFNLQYYVGVFSGNSSFSTLIQMYNFFIFLFKKCWVFVVFSFFWFLRQINLFRFFKLNFWVGRHQSKIFTLPLCIFNQIDNNIHLMLVQGEFVFEKDNCFLNLDPLCGFLII